MILIYYLLIGGIQLKKVYSIFILSACLWLFTACRNSPEVIDTTEALVVESIELSKVDGPTNVLFVQKNNNGFPQSQGVYDYHNGDLTIVKQYIPKRQQKEYPSLQEIQLNPIKTDFENTFTEIVWASDPYQVYEETQKDTLLAIDEEKIEFHYQEFQKIFYFDKEDKTIVRDDNFVEYTVQYDD